MRLEAAGRFAREDSTAEIAADLRVTERTVRRWRQAWQDGGAEALRSRGPVSREKLSPQQWTRLEQELRKGPLARGFAGDQRWTLGRIKTLIGKLFHVGYTIEGTGKLMRRPGWSCQVPVRRALDRDEEAIAVWKAEVSGRTSRPARPCRLCPQLRRTCHPRGQHRDYVRLRRTSAGGSRCDSLPVPGRTGTESGGGFLASFTLSYLVILAGFVSFGFATFRARVYPRWAGLVIVIGSVAAIVMAPLASVPSGPFRLDRIGGLAASFAFAWCGWYLLRRATLPSANRGR